MRLRLTESRCSEHSLTAECLACVAVHWHNMKGYDCTHHAMEVQATTVEVQEHPWALSGSRSVQAAAASHSGPQAAPAPIASVTQENPRGGVKPMATYQHGGHVW